MVPLHRPELAGQMSLGILVYVKDVVHTFWVVTLSETSALVRFTCWLCVIRKKNNEELNSM